MAHDVTRNFRSAVRAQLSRAGPRLGVAVVLAFAAVIVPIAHLEQKSVAGTGFGALLSVIDIFGLRWQIPALIDARADWTIGRGMPGWGRRRVLNRFGANLVRSVVLPLALLLALSVVFLPQPAPRTLSDPVGSFEAFVLSLYILVSEVGFALLAQRDFSAIDPQRSR
jgi:hypothetical protein